MKKIILIGSGNVATHLGLSLIQKGYNVHQIFSRNIKNADLLAKKLNCKSIDDLKNLGNADLIIVAVNDDAIKSVLQKLNTENIVHTSGSVGLEHFNKKFKNFGILYPLQTFNKDVNLDLSKTPLCIEASNKKFEKQLLNLGFNLSEKAVTMNTNKRKRLHIAAVFACNFTNHMFSLADNILKKSQLDFELLIPLINKTVSKIQSNKPSDVQTGPAKRKDKKIIEYHLNNISDIHTKEIYKIISKSILNENE